MLYGKNEGRRSSAEFDIASYRLRYPDLVNFSYGDLYNHWYDSGRQEGRNPAPAIDTDNDGIDDFHDECPEDSEKTEAGNCGCGHTEESCWNIALNKTATQSSTKNGGFAERAIDGNTSGVWADGSITHTQKDENAWWQVDLEDNYEIDSVKIFNNLGGSCAERMKDFNIEVYANGNCTSLVWSKYHSGTFNGADSRSFNINAVGRCVKIQLDHTDYLHMAEVQVFGSRESRLSSGLSHTCSIDNNNKLYCWGRNYYGHLGDGTKIDKYVPIMIGNERWESVSSGNFGTCGIRLNGDLYCWGWNKYGQIGDGTKVDKLVPTKVGNDTWNSISYGRGHVCGINQERELYCWGLTYSHVPTKIGDDTWSSVSSGENHTCGINSDGDLYCWGKNGNGQLGNGTTSDSHVPIKLEDNWSHVSCGANHTCAINDDDELSCWGSNGSGQLGGAALEEIIGLDGWEKVSAGSHHTCGTKSDGALYCWGSNGSGQLGNEGGLNYNSPINITDDDTWTGISVGGSHTCGVNNYDNKQYCWGSNWAGQLGNETQNSMNVPTEVLYAL